MPTQDATPSVEAHPAIQSPTDLQEGDRVVYPIQGVCRVTGTESKEIAGTILEFVRMTREEDSATILVPVTKIQSIGLRKVAGSVEIEDVFDLLASSFDDPELDWKVRHRHHVDLLSAGEILGVAEVVKALQGIANLRPLPQRERERYDAARRLLEDEIAVALGVPLATAEDFVDFALIPPPGTVRAPRKPRRLAEIPVKPKAAKAKRKIGDEEEEDLEELDLELDEAVPDELEEEELEGAGEEEEEEEEEALTAAPKKAAAKKPAKAEPKKAAPKKTAKAEPKKAAAKKTAKAEPKKAAAKKPAKAAAEKPAKAEPKKATAKKPAKEKGEAS